MVAPSGVETMLNARAQLGLQTFSYTKMSTAFPHSTVLMAKSLTQSIPFKSATDKKKQKVELILARRRAKSHPYGTRHGDGRGPYHFCTSKTFPDATYSFAARGAEIYSENAQHRPTTNNIITLARDTWQSAYRQPPTSGPHVD